MNKKFVINLKEKKEKKRNRKEENGLPTMKEYDVSPVWQSFGTRIEKDNISSEEAIELAGLDWDVELHPIQAILPDNNRINLDYNGTFRATDNKFLGGIVSPKYRPLQNREAFTFMDEVLQNLGASYESAGILNGGEEVWMLAKLPKGFEVVPKDKHINYLLLSNSHNSKYSVRVTFTTTRLVCWNQLRNSLKNGHNTIMVRHTKNLENNMKIARNTMDDALKHFENTKNFLKKASKTNVSNEEARNIFSRALDPVKKRDYNDLPGRTTKKVDELNYLFQNGIGNDRSEVRNTAYALINAATEYDTHYRSLHEREDGISLSEKRFSRVLFGETIQNKIIKIVDSILN